MSADTKTKLNPHLEKLQETLIHRLERWVDAQQDHLISLSHSHSVHCDSHIFLRTVRSEFESKLTKIRACLKDALECMAKHQAFSIRCINHHHRDLSSLHKIAVRMAVVDIKETFSSSHSSPLSEAVRVQTEHELESSIQKILRRVKRVCLCVATIVYGKQQHLLPSLRIHLAHQSLRDLTTDCFRALKFSDLLYPYRKTNKEIASLFCDLAEEAGTTLQCAAVIREQTLAGTSKYYRDLGSEIYNETHNLIKSILENAHVSATDSSTQKESEDLVADQFFHPRMLDSIMRVVRIKHKRFHQHVMECYENREPSDLGFSLELVDKLASNMHLCHSFYHVWRKTWVAHIIEKNKEFNSKTQSLRSVDWEQVALSLSSK